MSEGANHQTDRVTADSTLRSALHSASSEISALSNWIFLDLKSVWKVN